jgi:formylglycine-generating enzyme required for sulfatase activity/serine/threonine protein kinase
MNERELFLSALEIEDPGARQDHLQSACADDADLLVRVESLLASHESQSQFLNIPVVEQIAHDLAAGIDATILVGNGSTHDEESDAATADSNGPDPMNENRDDLDDEIPLGFLQPSSRPDSLGRLAHYEILEVIGRGAFGTVLKAFDEKLQRVVAIKVLAPEMAATSPARKRFLREARTSAAIRHENVVSIFAVEDDPTPYLVMEYIPGQTLQQRLDEHGPLDLPDVLRLGKQIADGLAAAHAEQLIHRDVKPGNILLETGIDDHVKITDFGLARTADDASVTQSGVIAGTPMYMAPEQALGQKLDQRADIFSFGSVLYQMLSGRPPFRAPSTMAVLKRVTEDTPRPITEIIPEVPDWMCRLVGHLHAKHPGDRYSSAKEVSDLLAKCLVDVQEGRKPKISAPSSPADDSAGQDSEKVRLRDGIRISDKPLLRVAAVVLMLLLAGLGITEATGVTKVATTVIRLTTGAGTLVIESDDPEVKIAIDGEEVTIRGGGVEELTLRPGEYSIAAVKDGKPVKQELVTITRNGRTVVRMSLETAGATAKSVVTKPPRTDSFQWPADAAPPAIAPFDADQARAHQQAWAKYLGVPMEKEVVVGQNADGEDVKLTMVLIPPGEFMMGSTKEEQAKFLEEAKAANDKWGMDRISKEGPQHRVRITRPFWLSHHEVTLGQFRQFVEETGYKTDGERDGKGGFGIFGGKWSQDPRFVWNADDGSPQTDEHPVVNVSWNDATAFRQWLSKRHDGVKYELPTEAQWEYACRAGTTTAGHNGDSEEAMKQHGWCRKNAGGKTHPVGQLRPNGFGVYDMHGNAWEWCQDYFLRTYDEKLIGKTSVDPLGPSEGSRRAFRGAGWFHGASHCRSAIRNSDLPGHSDSNLGFRLAATLPDDVIRAKLSPGSAPAAQLSTESAK